MISAHLGRFLRHLRQAVPAPEETVPDGFLLARFAERQDESAFEQLFHRHAPMVLGVCRRILGDGQDAEDAFQATWLVLVRKASSLSGGGVIANWLYGVAQRTALHSRRATAKRRASERKMGLRPELGGLAAAAVDDRDVLDGELAKLPDKYRAAVVLCDLEGLTRVEAARALGCAEGTVASRLARARALLARRLARHGLVPSGLTLAAPSAALTVSTIKAATTPTTIAAGQGAGAVNVQAALLAQRVIRAMFFSKVKVIGATIALVFGLLGVGLAQLPLPGQAGGFKEARKPEKPKEKAGAAAAGKADAKPAAVGAASSGSRAVVRALLQPATFTGADDPKTTLKDVLKQLEKTHNVAFRVNSKAFKYEMLNDVLSTPVGGADLAPMRSTLARVLQHVLNQIPVPSGATYMTREDGIEITTSQFKYAEVHTERDQFLIIKKRLGGDGKTANAFGLILPPEARLPEEEPPKKISVSVVSLDLDRQPLEEALRQMRAQTSINVVIDPSLGEKARVPVTATLLNAPLDSAMLVLTEMTELDFVWLDNIFYVTSKEKAAKLKEKWPARRGGGGDLVITGPVGGM
jgi:RNA polymerase sigma factor (sigma-70 family)